MNDLDLYIDITPGKSYSKDAITTLSSVLSLFNGSATRITWLYHGRRLSFFTMLSLIITERKLCKNRELAINNAIRSTEIQTITPAAIQLLRDFNFTVVIPSSSSHKLQSKLHKRSVDLTEEICGQENSISNFQNWLQTAPEWNTAPFTDYVRMALQLKPNLCKYTSCLGKTIYIDLDGKLYSCPFSPMRIALNDISTCSLLEDAFDTPQYTEVLKSSIERRSQCQNTCSIYSVCKGGCPLETGDCPETKLRSDWNVLNTSVNEAADRSHAVCREFCSVLAQKFRI